MPKNTTRTTSPLVRPLQLADFPNDEVALEAAKPIEEELTVEVIDLVLQGAGE